MIDGFMTAKEIKPLLGIVAKDNRTLNKYAKQGKLEIRFFSKKNKLYRPTQGYSENKETFLDEEWIIAQ